jgi:hypothetical protein
MQIEGETKSKKENKTRPSRRKKQSGWKNKTRSTHQQTSTTFAKFKSKKNSKRRNSSEYRPNSQRMKQRRRTD